MRDEDKTKEQLIRELKLLRRKLAERSSRKHSAHTGPHTTAANIAMECAEGLGCHVGSLPSLDDLTVEGKNTDRAISCLARFEATNKELRAQITKRERAERAVEAERQRLFTLLNSLPSFIFFMLRPDRTFSFANLRFCEEFGQVEGKHCFQVLKGCTEPCRECPVDGIFNQGHAREWELTHPVSGRTYRFYGYSSPGEAKTSSSLILGTDITERKTAEEALRRQDQQFRRLVETMNEGLVVQDENGCIEYVNGKLCEMLGYGKDEPLGRSILGFLDGEALDIYYRQIEERRRGKHTHYEIELRTKEGRPIPVLVSGSPIFDDKGDFRGSIATVTDITILKEAEQKLRESEWKYRMIFNNSPLGIVHFDSGGIITACNDKLASLGGHLRKRLVGLNLLVYLKDKQARAAVLDCLAGKPSHFEGNYGGPRNRKSPPIRAYYSPMLSEEGSVLGGIGIVEDISEQKRTEAILKESEKQLRFLSAALLSAQEEERKRIAAELHDSIGSSLTAVKFSLEKTLKLMEEGEIAAYPLRSAISITQHAMTEVRRMMTDLRPSMLDDIGIVSTIGWFCRQFESVYTSIKAESLVRVEEEEIPQSLKTVIFRIMQESFNNAAKYSGATVVTVSLERYGTSIELTVADNGGGFDLEAALLKESHKKGLGLTSMKERAELSGGLFSIRSSSVSGTTIRVVWPNS
ncbi:MAG: PAS domain S-box protein [Acidobacteriota bacterium]